jgi:hypothetical protein
MLAEPVLGNAIPYIASAVVPGAVFTLPMPCTFARPDIVAWRMRGLVPVIASVFIGRPVMRLMNFRPVRLLVVLRRTYVMPRFGSRCLAVVPMLRRSLVVVVVALRPAVMFVPMILGTAVMVVIVAVLCVRRSACC